MAPDLATAPRSVSNPMTLGVVVVAATIVVTGARVGALPGGQVGWDVLLAAFGASVARGVRTPGDVVARLRRSLAVVWPAAVAALALAIAWVLTRSSTRYDSLVRGEALGLFGGYGNWQQAARGPSEADLLVTPLQGVWPLAVAVQLLLVWAALAALTRRRAATRPLRPDPLLGVGVIAAGLGVAWSLCLLILGVTANRMSFGSDVHAVAFLLGAASGAGLTVGLSDRSRAGLRAVAPVLGLLLVAAAVAMAPDSSLWTGGGAVLVPVLAGVLVVAVGAASEGRPPAASRVPKLPFDPLVALVSFLVVQGAAVALVAGGVDGATAIPARAGGLVLGAVVAIAVTHLGTRRSWSPVAVERRRVLVPPAITVALVVILSVTGAFHWSSPHPVPPSKPAASTGGG